MNIKDILDEPLYFKDHEGSDPERSITHNVAEYLNNNGHDGLVLYLPSKEQVDALLGYLLVIGRNIQVKPGTSNCAYYISYN